MQNPVAGQFNRADASLYDLDVDQDGIKVLLQCRDEVLVFIRAG